jgi:hypothetical protein
MREREKKIYLSYARDIDLGAPLSPNPTTKMFAAGEQESVFE